MSNEFDSDWQKTKRIVWKMLGFVFLLAVVIGPAGFALKMCWRPAEVLDRVTGADRMIYTYEQFHNLHQGWLALEDQESNAQATFDAYCASLPASRERWTYSDRQEQNRLRTVVLGLQNRRRELAAQYNAMSDQITRDFLRGRSLPDHLPTD